jgi:hypothetical protein
MLQPLQDLRSFVINRFAPCVYCYATPEAIVSHANIAATVITEWAKVMTNLKNNIRIIFPFAMATPAYLENELSNPRLFNPNSPPFNFLKKEPNIGEKKELKTIKLIRQRMFEMNFLPPQCTSDIPIASIVIVRGNEIPRVSIDNFPNWSKQHICQIPMKPIRLPNPQLYDELLAFYQEVLVKIPRSLAEKEAVYNTTWSNKTSFSLFFASDDKINQMIVVMKRFADSRMIQQKFGEAAELYKKLSDMKGYPQIISQCKLMAAFATIADGKTDGIEEYFAGALDGVSSLYEACGIQLCLFWCSMLFKNNKGLRALNRVMELLIGNKDLQFLIPFLMQQSACFYKRRKSALILALASSRFLKMRYFEHAAHCLWGAFKGANEIEELVQINGSSISQTVLQSPEAVDLTPIVREMVKCRNILIPDQLKDMIKNYPPGKCFCGFVRPIITAKQAKGFSSAIPDGFRGSWPERAKTVFAAYTGFSQFQVKKKIDCCVGEKVSILVCLRCSCLAYILDDIELVASIGEIETTKVSVSPEIQKFVELSFIPKSEGDIEISGIEFKWCDTLLEAHFSHEPLQLFAYSDCPLLEVEKPKLDLNEIRANDIFQIELHVKNVGKQLKHLSFQTYGDASMKLIEPQENEFTGFKFLRALKEGEEYNLRVAIQATEGKHDIGIILPYWTEHGPPRYEHFYISFDASPYKPFPIDQIQCRIKINCSPYVPIGFTCPSFNCISHSKIDEETNTGVFSQVAREKGDAEPFVAPDFCTCFGCDGIRLWARKGDVYSSQQLENFEAPVVLLIKNIGVDRYVAAVTNIGNQTIHIARFSFLEPDEKVTFIISGIELRIIDSIKPGETSSFSFSLVFFDIHNIERPPKIMIAAEEFLAVSDLSL